MRVTGLDLSLTGSGVAQISTDPVCPVDGAEVTTSGGRHEPRCIKAVCRYEGPGITTPRVTGLQEFGSQPAGEDLTARGARLRSVATPVIRAARGSDLILIEDLYMGSGTGGQLDRAGLFWLVVATLTAEGHPVALVTNNHLKMYALGKGAGKGTDKDYVLAAVVRRYPDVPVQSNNTADALVLAAMGARHLGSPLETDLPDTHLRAMKAVHWPATNR